MCPALLSSATLLAWWCVYQIDMVDGRVISREEGSSLAARMGCEYFETSAKTGAGVEDAFMSMAEHIMCGGPRRERRKLLAAKQRLLWARVATAILTTSVCPLSSYVAPTVWSASSGLRARLSLWNHAAR